MFFECVLHYIYIYIHTLYTYIHIIYIHNIYIYIYIYIIDNLDALRCRQTRQKMGRCWDVSKRDVSLYKMAILRNQG